MAGHAARLLFRDDTLPRPALRRMHQDLGTRLLLLCRRRHRVVRLLLVACAGVAQEQGGGAQQGGRGAAQEERKHRVPRHGRQQRPRAARRARPDERRGSRGRGAGRRGQDGLAGEREGWEEGVGMRAERWRQVPASNSQGRLSTVCLWKRRSLGVVVPCTLACMGSQQVQRFSLDQRSMTELNI